jgi:hypothetical protein
MSGRREIPVGPIADAAKRPSSLEGSASYACWVDPGSSGHGEEWTMAAVHPPRDDGPTLLAAWVAAFGMIGLPFWVVIAWAVWRLFQ